MRPYTASERPASESNTWDQFESPLSPRDAVEASLARSGHPQLWRVQVNEVDGRIQLSGTVKTYYAKQLAQTAAMAVPGVRAVCNDLVVK